MTDTELTTELLDTLRMLRSEIAALSEKAEAVGAAAHAAVSPVQTALLAFHQAAAHHQQELEAELHAVEEELSALGHHYEELQAGISAEQESTLQHLSEFHAAVEKRRPTHQQQAEHTQQSLRHLGSHTQQEHSRLAQAQEGVQHGHQRLQQDTESHHHRSQQLLEEVQHHGHAHLQHLQGMGDTIRQQWFQHADGWEGALGDVSRALSHGSDGLQQMAFETVERQVQEVVQDGLGALENAVEDSLHRLTQDAGELGSVRGLVQPLVEELGHLFHPLQDHAAAVHHRAAELGIQS